MWIAPALWTLPWILPKIVTVVRARRSHSLNEFSASPPSAPPKVSIIIPARNEAHNIGRCVSSILASTYPSLDVIVVDDHSIDGTGEIASKTITQYDGRTELTVLPSYCLTVLQSPPLPSGWFGKQWACATGARAATGDILLFTDADTWHAPDLHARAVNALRARRADLLTVGPRQEMETFWERVIQPQMFSLLSLRFGGTEAISHPRTPADAIANGQFMLMRRETYDALGGHELVRDRVAEDLAIAQELTRRGKTIVMLEAIDQMSTRMYRSLGELIGGWRKNIYAGGRTSALGGTLGRTVYPLVLPAMPVVELVPVLALMFALVGALSKAWLFWSGAVTLLTLVYWFSIYKYMKCPAWYCIFYPVGEMMLLYIALGAVARGQNVRWKDREYLSE